MLRRLVGDEVEIVLGLCAEPLPIDADRGHLAQILLNLVANARDAMPQGGTVTISTERAGTDAPAAVLRIADTGTGMDAETRSHMFEPFFTTKPTGKGTGLGLATSYGFVQGMGGAMGVESEVGSGSVFTISLPLAAGEEHRGSGDEEAPHPGLLGGGTTSILLVEDQEPVRAMTRRLLEQAGYLVTDIGDPVAVLDLDDRALGPFHLMLTDVSMPVLSGLQLAHQVRKRRPDLPTLFMSGYNNERLEEHYGLTGQPVLQKPFDRQALLSAVSAALGR
jgi:CheY-like chemotaxis protein